MVLRARAWFAARANPTLARFATSSTRLRYWVATMAALLSGEALSMTTTFSGSPRTCSGMVSRQRRRWSLVL